jgi:hypothetical protein
MSILKGSYLALIVVSAAFIAGCSQTSQPSAPKDNAQASAENHEHHEHGEHAHGNSDIDSEVQAALAELSEEDRTAAKSQKFCAAEPENLLGSMGAPFKLMIEGQPVFLCCEGCKDAALKDPQATLAAVAKLKASNSPGK